MAEAVILSLIQKLEKYKEKEINVDIERDRKFGGKRRFNFLKIINYQEHKRSKYKEIGRVIEEMKEIVDIVRDKKFREGRRLNFLVSDLAHMADAALDLCKDRKTTEMWSVLSWIGEIKMWMLKLGVDGPETVPNTKNENADEDEDVVVGLDKAVDVVLRTMICDIRPYHSVVLIKGMSGIGKTTFTREIYNHADVVERFKYRAWVCVSNVLTLKEIIIKLLLQVQVVVDGDSVHTSSSLEEMDNQSLLYMLRQHLQGLSCLIVLDDLPKQILETSLECSPRNSKIECDDHQMEPLDSIMSWQLFYKTISSGNKLRSEQKFPKELEYQGKLMLRKCGGLPLAIKEVANQLAQKKASTGTEWEQLLEDVDFASTLELLEPYYKKLDPELLPCFMYMALFKANTTLRANKLSQIWKALGLDDSELYVDCLVEESIIYEVNNKRNRYRMNPVLHRLSIKKAEEGIDLEILGSTRLNGNPRHRVIICSRDNFNYSTNHDKYLVSLFFHGGGYFNASPSYWKGFEKLEILDLEDFGLKILPETIGILMKLIYLGLRNNYIKELPKSLGCLENLEVLDIAQNLMVQVPHIIWEMGSLRHLYMSDVIWEKPFKMDVLQRLSTLTSVSVDNMIYDWFFGLKMLRSLKKLGVQDLDGNTHVSKLFVLLSDLGSLEHLILRGYRFKSMPCLDELGTLQHVKRLKLDGRLDRLPNNFPSQLTSLTLANSCLDEDPMPLLGKKLPELGILKLQNAYTGQQMDIVKDDFPQLIGLWIEKLWNLRNLQIEENALNRLCIININKCPYLDTLPEEVRAMRDLKELKMVTTKTISTNIRNTHSISKIRFVDINP